MGAGGAVKERMGAGGAVKERMGAGGAVKILFLFIVGSALNFTVL